MGLGLLNIVSSYRCRFIIILPYVSVEILVDVALPCLLALRILVLVERSNIFRRSHIHLLVAHALASHSGSSRSCWLVIKRDISEMAQFFKLNGMSDLVLSILIW